MRILIFFDLPSIEAEEKKEYRQFRKFLVENGFLMLQESVYAKIALNPSVVKSVTNNIKKNKPTNGLIQVLTITEKQFNNMEFILGEFQSEILFTDERLVIL